MTQPPRNEQMISRPRLHAPDKLPGHAAPARRPEFRIEITAADGAPLLILFEQRGHLIVEGDESRWGEAAKRFLYQMMQWSGQVGIRWKDEAIEAGQDRA